MSHEIDRLKANIRIRVPGVLDDAMNLEIFNVIDELCKEANVWQESIPLELNSQELEYELEPEENRAQIVRLLSVTANGIPVAAFLPEPNRLVFPVAPSSNTDIEHIATVALAPIDPVNQSDGLPDCPDWLFTLYSTDLQDGVLSKLMSQPAKPYTSPNGFLYHGRRWRNAIAKANAAMKQQNTYGAQAWRFPPFAQCRK